MIKNIILAKSWRGNEYYYNWAKGFFVNCNDAHIWVNDDFECDDSMLEGAKEQAFMENLKDVKLMPLEQPVESL